MRGLLSGRRALVTGGTRGIGAAIAARLAAQGARVWITGRGKPARPPRGMVFRSVDFADRPSVEAFAGEVSTLRIDILVNNAGINKIAPFEKTKTEDYDRIQDVNARTPFLLCRAALPHMRRRRWGRIVNICSVFGVISKEFRAPYSASKFALDGMTAALAAEVARYGVLANSLAPGFIDTDLTRSILGASKMRALAARVPTGRLGRPEEIAELAVWLAGPLNTYVSGQNIVIDGGFSRV